MTGLKIATAFVLTLLSVVLVPVGHAQTRQRQIVTIYAHVGGNRVSLGTGFLVGPSVVATAYHVIEGATSIDIYVDGIAKPMRQPSIRGIAPKYDLALLNVPGLASVQPLGLRLTLPGVGAKLSMIGAAAGIPGSTYPATLVKPEAIPLTSFADGNGRSFYPGMQDVRVLHIAGIIYNGISGGPLLDDQRQVVGVVCGSLNVGGAAGWAIPSTYLSDLLALPSSGQAISGFQWPRGIRTNASRSLAFVQMLDPNVEKTVNDFTALASRLGEINSQLSIHSSLASYQLIDFQSKVFSHSATAKVAIGGWPVERLNQDLAAFSDAEELRLIRTLLAERFEIDRDLRAVVARLEDAVGREDLDQVNKRRLDRAAENVRSYYPEVSATTFERVKGIDRVGILDSLDTMIDVIGGPFRNIEEAVPFANQAKLLVNQLNKYTYLDNRFVIENLYFERAAEFIRFYRGVIVFVPDN